jgi:hypothetical protein
MEQSEIDALVDDIRDGMLHAWEKSGWIQFAVGNDKQGFCMMGAFYRATMRDQCLMQVWRQAVKDTIEDLFPGRPANVESFNDRTFTTREDVELCAKHAFERMKPLLGKMINGPDAVT